MPLSHKYLSNLTPLRGIAALWVVVFHFQVVVIQFIFPAQTMLVAKGYLMVDLFFIMSGFIICHVYQQSFAEGFADGNFRKFIAARFARIYPLHLFTLLIMIGLIAASKSWNPIDDPKAILPNIFLIHSFNTTKVYTWNIPSWSISAEWWAYMVFPLLMIFIHRKKTIALSLLGLFTVTAYIAIMFWIPRHDPFDPKAIVPHDLNATYDFGFLRGLAGFVAGILLYKVYEARIAHKLFQSDLAALLLIIGTLVCLHFGINDGLYIILFIGLVYTFALNNGKLHALCNNWVAQYLGKISYSIYLSSLFAFIVFTVMRLPGVAYQKTGVTSGFWVGLGYCLALLIVHVGFSSLTYYTIEKPCRKYLNRKWRKESVPSIEPLA